MQGTADRQSGPVRVLRIIGRLNVGGPAKHVAWLMSGMDRLRFSQTLVAGTVEPNENDMGDWVNAQGVEYTVVPHLSRSIRPVSDLASIFHLVRSMLRESPHIVATHTSKAGFVGRVAFLLYKPLAWLTGRPQPRCVHTFHGHTFHSYFGPLKSRIFLALERFLAKAATWRIVVISDRQLKEIRDRYQVGRPGQFVRVPLGIDLKPFNHPDRGRESFRRELGVKDDEIVIGAVGRIAPVKNFALFVQAAAGLKAAHPDQYRKTRFVLIGGGGEDAMADLAQLARRLGVENRFSLLGNRDDPEKFFPGMDILAVTSLNEGTPVAILEGGAVGLPVVATEVGGILDLLGEAEDKVAPAVTQRHRGLSVPSGGARAVAEAIHWLMDNPTKSEMLGSRLQKWVRATHQKDRLVNDISRLYLQYPNGKGRLHAGDFKLAHKA